MNQSVRIRKSIINSGFSVSLIAVTMLLNFFSRSIFLTGLGSDILGLNSTLAETINIFNIAEMGIGVAIASSLYRPLAQKDYPRINSLLSVHAILYRRIGIVIAICACCISLLFPFMFADSSLPLWYSYAIFFVLTFNSLLWYFINFRNIILSASQSEYKIKYSYQSVLVLKVFFQIIAIYYFEQKFLWWLSLEFIFPIIATIALQIVIRYSAPFIHIDYNKKNINPSDYTIIISKTKRLLFHKIGEMFVSHISIVIIFAFSSLAVVTNYTNYNLIIAGVTLLMYNIFNSIGASVGNLIATTDRHHSIEVYKQFRSIGILISASFGICIYILAPQFIALWIGADYIMPSSTVILMTAIMFFTSIYYIDSNFLNAYNLFSDIWAPITMIVINLIFSISLGFIWGINGIIFGSLISYFVIMSIWKPYYLFRIGFRTSFHHFITFSLKHLVGVCITAFIALSLPIDSITYSSAIATFAIRCVTLFASVFSTLFIYMYLTSRSVRLFVHRFF